MAVVVMCVGGDAASISHAHWTPYRSTHHLSASSRSVSVSPVPRHTSRHAPSSPPIHCHARHPVPTRTILCARTQIFLRAPVFALMFSHRTLVRSDYALTRVRSDYALTRVRSDYALKLVCSYALAHAHTLTHPHTHAPPTHLNSQASIHARVVCATTRSAPAGLNSPKYRTTLV